jgi:CRP-like cAMP-binding protein
MKRIPLKGEQLGTLAHMLRRVDFFSPLTVGDMDQVLPYIMSETFAPGENIFAQGEPGDAFYIVETGKVEVWLKRGFFSFSKMVAQLGPGDIFGEMALISTDPRNATVTCAEATKLFVLVAADFQFVLKKNPQTAAEMQRIAERRKFRDAHLTNQ